MINHIPRRQIEAFGSHVVAIDIAQLTRIKVTPEMRGGLRGTQMGAVCKGRDQMLGNRV